MSTAFECCLVMVLFGLLYCLYRAVVAYNAYVLLQMKVYEDDQKEREEMKDHAKAHMESIREQAEDLMKNPPPEVFGRHMEQTMIKRTTPLQ